MHPLTSSILAVLKAAAASGIGLALLSIAQPWASSNVGGKNMANLKPRSSKGTSLLLVAAIVLYAMTAGAQNPTDSCKPAHVIPLTVEEAPAKIVIDPPLAEPLASRGVVII